MNVRKTELRKKAGDKGLKNALLAAEITEGADVGDDECGGKAVFRAHLAQVDAAVLKGQAAAVSVVADLNDLTLQRLVCEIIAHACGEIESFAGQVAVPDEGTDLARKRLLKGYEARRERDWKIALDGVVVQAEVGNGGEEFAVGLDLQKRADGDEALNLRFILENLLEVVEAAGSDFEIANNGRPVTRPEGECKGRDGVERFENVTLAVHDGSAEGGIEIMLLIDAPGEKFLGLVVASFGKEALGDAVFDFAGIG